jgi:hypothetical protein
MTLKINHKKNRFWINPFTQLRIYLWMLWNKNKTINVKVDFPQPIDITEDKEEHDWLKIIGWKDGINTSTNNEHMLVYRKKGDYIEFADYLRIDGFYSDDNTTILDDRQFRFKNGSWVSVEFYTFFFRDRDRDRNLNIPTCPWAGGTNPPNKNYSYYLTLKVEK